MNTIISLLKLQEKELFHKETEMFVEYKGP